MANLVYNEVIRAMKDYYRIKEDLDFTRSELNRVMNCPSWITPKPDWVEQIVQKVKEVQETFDKLGTEE
jgi:hypothetical protein